MPNPSKDILLQMMRNANIGLFEFNPLSGAVKVDDTYASGLGYQKEEHSNLEAWLNIIHPDYLAKSERELREFLESDQTSSVSVLPLKRKDGSYKWIRGTIFKSDSNTLFGCYVDLSEEREAQKSLEIAKEEALKSEIKLRSLFNSMEDLVLEIDENGTYLSVAPTKSDPMDLIVDDLPGKTLFTKPLVDIKYLHNAKQ